MSITSFLMTSVETRELHADAKLRTHYYRNSFKDCLKVVEALCESFKMDLRNSDSVHGEIYVIGNGFDAIITCLQLTPIETGIDIKVNYFSFIGFNRPRKKILKFYEFFDQNLKFKGVSLHP